MTERADDRTIEQRSEPAEDPAPVRTRARITGSRWRTRGVSRLVSFNDRNGQPTRMTGAALPLLLTANEVAEILRTSRKAVYAMIERGQLSGVIRIGRRILVRRKDLLDWLDQKRTPSLEE